jgi:hypothetical protein
VSRVVPRDVFVRPSQSFGWVVESRKPDGRVGTWWFPTKGIAKAVGRKLSRGELGPLAGPHVAVPPSDHDGSDELSSSPDR